MSKTFFNEKTAQTIEILQKVFKELEIPAYLIGAQARDIWFLPQKLPRFTHDIDWVIANSSEEVFKELKNKLLQDEGFSETSNPIKFKSPNGSEVDLIPFNHAEMPNFVGLHEIFERGTEFVTFNNGNIYSVATIPAIVILKLIAWQNKPEYRTKDVYDISTMIDHYFDLFSDDIYDNHNDLFGERELNQIGARVIGRKMRLIIGDSLDLKNKIIAILEHNANPNNPKMANIIVNKTENSLTYTLSLLNEMLIGIKE